MFSNICRRLRCAFKLKTRFAIFFILLVTLAFANFFLLISLRTNVHDQSESLVESLFFIHFHGNVSLVSEEGHDGLSEHRLYEIHSTVKPLKSNKAGVLANDKITTKANHHKVQQFTTSGVNDNCTAWCRRGNALKPPYLLTAVLLVRIYRHDLAKLSSREMIQWLGYLRYAGFQHVYVYDAFVAPSESQRDVIEPFVQSGFATYIDWSAHNPYTIQGTQVAAYQDCINKFGKDSKWQAAIDIDEYPFSPRDLNQNFMARFLNEYSKNNADISEITMPNYLFLGKPINDKTEPLLIARIRRRTPKPANPLVKPIYKPAAIGWAQVHHNGVKSGHSQNSPDTMLRMNHYWGARLQDWGEDTPKILDMTVPDYTIKPIVERMKQCADCLGEKDLYQTRWA